MIIKGVNDKYLISNATYNSFVVAGINPFYPTRNIQITIEYPVVPDYNVKEEIKIPEIGLGDFLQVLPQYRELVEEGGDIYHILMFLLKLAQKMVSYKVIMEDDMYKYLVVLYTAHYLELQIRDLKDEANKNNNNNEIQEKNYYINDLKTLLSSGKIDELLLTQYGIRFKNLYESMFNLHVKGGYSKHGKY